MHKKRIYREGHRETLHTTLALEIRIWLDNESERRGCSISCLVEDIVLFYQKNKELPEMFISLRVFLKQLIKEELAEIDSDKFTSVRSYLQHLIQEELKNKLSRNPP